MSPSEDEFQVWVNQQPARPGHLGYRTAWLKDGPRVAKTVVYGEFGDPVTGEVKNRELRFRTARRQADGHGFDFADPTKTWACENDEITKLLAFLDDEVGTSGRYRLVETSSPQAVLADLLDAGDIDVEQLVAALVTGGNVGQLVAALSREAGGLAAAESAVLEQRRELVVRLQQMAADPATTETDMQSAMGEQYWLFGGRYVGVADRRNLTVLDSFDIPLLGADGTLHIVELKGPNVPGLVRGHRNHLMVGAEVHSATSQAMNYLRSLDEQGAALSTTYRNEYGWDVDMRRVFATVVIGHPAHVSGAEARQVEQTIRTYNAHLSRVEVITWATLLDSAARALEFEQHAATTAQETAAGAADVQAPSRPEPSAWEPPF